MSYRLQTIIEADEATPPTLFTPSVINVGGGDGIPVSDFSGNENTCNNSSTLFIKRTGALPSQTPTQTPTMTPTKTPTPTPTPTVSSVNLVPTLSESVIVNTVATLNSRSTGDRLFIYYSSDNFASLTRTQWAYLPNSTTGNTFSFTNTCADFKDNDNLVIATMCRDGVAGPIRLLRQTVRNRSTWGTYNGLNDIQTNSTTLANFNSTDPTSPFFSRGDNTTPRIDMFVHRNSNTAVYIITQIPTISEVLYSNPSFYGITGAAYFTVNLANNAVSAPVRFTNHNLCFNRYY